MENQKSSIDYAAIAEELRTWPAPSMEMPVLEYNSAVSIHALARAIEEVGRRRDT